MADWEPRKKGLRWVVQRCVFADWAGSGYVFAREAGKVMRFWRQAAAQAYADKLNKEPQA